MKHSLYLDLISYFFVLVPAITSWTTTLYLYKLSGYSLFFIPIIPISLIVVLALSILLLRTITPDLKKGVYQIGLSKGYLAWCIQLSLLRSIYFSGLRPIVHSLHIFRYIIYNSLGANIPLSLSTAINFELVDLPLISIGKNCSLGDNVKFSCHIMMKGKLILRPVKIGDNCVIASRSEIRPGTVLNEGETFPKTRSKE